MHKLAIKSQHPASHSFKTHESLAKYLANQNLVNFYAKTGTFLEDTLNRKRHANVLNELSCSCSSKNVCVHIQAARFAKETISPK